MHSRDFCFRNALPVVCLSTSIMLSMVADSALTIPVAFGQGNCTWVTLAGPFERVLERAQPNTGPLRVTEPAEQVAKPLHLPDTAVRPLAADGGTMLTSPITILL